MEIALRRTYEPPTPDDCYRVLVDRVWPRGRSRDDLTVDEWAKDIAPIAELRRRFGLDPPCCEAFGGRYGRELSSPAQRARLRRLLEAAEAEPLTLDYGAKDEEHNHARVLREVLFAGAAAMSRPCLRSDFATRAAGARRYSGSV
jgi:uncharacterized protein YeaO (DUF488 family)